jgi:hypothetical protein
MKKQLVRILAVASLAAAVAGPSVAAGEPNRYCSDSLVRGTYAVQMQGTRPAFPGGPTETVIGVLIRLYDGKGHVTQVDNIKGSVSGWFPDRFGAGTYHVNDDCTVVIDFEPVPGLFVQERAVIVDNGRELRSIVTTPATFMITAVHQRV